MTDLKNKKISAISLGCDKNRVDLEKMLFKLSEDGFEIVPEVEDADIVIVNTCSFISSAKEEAIKNIFDMCLLKEKGVIEKVIVTGCLPQQHKKSLQEEIKEVDRFLTLAESQNICEVIEELYGVEPEKHKSKLGRVLTNHSSYAYLKIADGCNNGCSFCTIPRIRGRYISAEMDDIIDEAKYLAKLGVRELILVAQDVSRYGEDLYKENRLIPLLKKLSKIDGIELIRLHYIYPEKTTKELLDFIEQSPKVCKYIDIPLQHIDDRLLKSMNRRLGEQDTRELLKLIKEEYKDIKIRSTFIVGYPSETRAEFKKLCEFLKETRFDYAGFFPYYNEENTASYYIKKQHSQFIKNHRYKVITKLQNKIAYENAAELLGKTYKTLIDYFDEENGYFVGHTEFLSPSVDFGVQIVDNGSIEKGKFYNVKFDSFDGEYFKGEVNNELT